MYNQQNEELQKCRPNIMDLFITKDLVKICAPMVRYSKLQFRNLVKTYNCDLCFTPMILADSFCKSNKARNNEFTTNLNDVPLVTQFAANTIYDFVGAADLVSPFCDGVDLNCGCPQRWAKQQGLGCIMLEKPQLIYDLVRECRNRIAKPFTVSVKMRLKKDLRKSVEICRELEHCGVSFLTIHARTPDQITGDINKEALSQIIKSVSVPVIANGGLKSMDECSNLQEITNCKGVMIANGLLTNPTLYTGTTITPLDCVQKWVNICYNTTLNQNNKNQILTIQEKPNNLTFQCFHHHLVFMLEKILTKFEKRIFNNLQTFSDVLEFLKNRFLIVPKLYDDDDDFVKSQVLNLDYSGRDNIYEKLKPDECEIGSNNFLYDCSNEGSFFQNKIQDKCDWFDMFIENG